LIEVKTSPLSIEQGAARFNARSKSQTLCRTMIGAPITWRAPRRPKDD
jgi:hypothetical protein